MYISICVCMYVCIYIYIYIYIYTRVCEQTFLLGKPLPCKPAAKTGLQSLIWHSESLSSHIYHCPEECLFHRPVWRLHRKRSPTSGTVWIPCSGIGFSQLRFVHVHQMFRIQYTCDYEML